MKTEAMLHAGDIVATATPRASLADCQARAASEAACAAVAKLIAGRTGKDVDLVNELVARVRDERPVPFARDRIAWTAFRQEMSDGGDRVFHTARLAAAGDILLPHMRKMQILELNGTTEDPSAVMAIDISTPADVVANAMSLELPTLLGTERQRTLAHLMETITASRTLPSFNHKVTTAVVLHGLGITGRAAVACSKIIIRWSPAFHLDAVPSALRNGEVVALETAPVAIERFLKNREGGPPLAESNRRKGQASLREIDADLHIGYARLRNYRHLIDAAVASNRVKLGPRVVVDNEEAERIRALRRQRLAFVDRCFAENIALPISTTNRRAYDLDAIAAMDTETVGESLSDDLTYIAEMYKRAAIKELPEDIAVPGTTYGQFDKELRRERKAELMDRKSSSSMLAQTMRAYTDYRKVNARMAHSAIIGDELSTASVERTIAKVEAGGAAGIVTDVSIFRTNIRIVARIHAQVASDDGLGDDPGKAISIALRRSKESLPALSAKTGISENALHGALHSGAYRSAELTAGLPALEKALELDEGRLANASKSGRGLSRLTTKKRSIPARMQDFVSDEWATMDDTAFEEMVAWIEDNLLRQPTPFGRAMSMAVKLGREAARIRTEMNAERRLGSDVEEDQKTPYQRSIERLVAHKMGAFEQDDLKRKGGLFWVDHTARMRIAMLIDLGNFITDPVEAGGLGVDPDTFDLPHLLNTNYAKVYSDQMAHRLVDVEWGGRDGKKRGPLFTRLHADLMVLLASIFREKWGFAYQQPDMAKAITAADDRPLPPIKYLVSTNEVRKVLKNFVAPPALPMPTIPAGLVDLSPEAYQQASIDACDRYSTLGADLHKRCKRSRDPIATIKGIVHDDNPVRLALEHLRLALNRVPSLVADPLGHHLHFRNMAVSIFGLIVTFRPRNMRELTSSGEETQIWIENGRWRIEIPHDRFKNWTSTPLFADKSPFERTLPEIPGFYEIMEYYSERSLPFLVGNQGTPNFFVDAKGQALTGLSYWRLMRDFTARHLAHNPYLERGIVNVMPFNPYAWRYIRATDVLLHPTPGGNPYLEAANALQTSEAMIMRYYGRVRPDARNSKQDERICKLFGSIW